MGNKKMKRSKPKVKYQGLAFSVPFIQEIKDHIKEDDKYRSVTDFVRQAAREKIEKDITVTAIKDRRKKEEQRIFKEKYGMSYEEYREKYGNGKKYFIGPYESDDKRPDLKYPEAPTLLGLEARINILEKKLKTKKKS